MILHLFAQNQHEANTRKGGSWGPFCFCVSKSGLLSNGQFSNFIMSVFLVQHGKILLIKVVITRIIASSTAGASAQLELVLETVPETEN